MRSCVLLGCERKHYARGWCTLHYSRWRIHGDPLGRSTPRAFRERHVVEESTGCWVWQGAKDPKGYGQLTYEGRSRRAHRVYYERYVGPVPVGLELDHLCRVRNCVNPAHLEPVTTRENIMRGEGVAARNARKTHCPKGHPYDARNTEVVKKGKYRGRRCIQCRTDAERLRMRRLSADLRAQGLNSRGKPYTDAALRVLAGKHPHLLAEIGCAKAAA